MLINIFFISKILRWFDPLRTRRREFSILWFLCDRHPMVLYADSLKRTGVKKTCELPALYGRRVQTRGWRITGKRVRTKKGDPMEFLTFEDETGLVETVLFPEAYDRFAPIIDFNRPYRLWGKVETDWGSAAGARKLSVSALIDRLNL